MNIYNPKKSKKIVIYVNPGFTGVHGYYQNHAVKFLEEVKRSGIAMLHLTNQDMDDCLANEFFSNRTYRIRPHLSISKAKEDRCTMVKEFVSETVRVLKSERLSEFEYIHIYMYSGHPEYAAALSTIISEFSINTHAVVNFLYNEKELETLDQFPDLKKRLQTLGELLNENDKGSQISLAVDCPLARSLYGNCLGREIQLLPSGCSLQWGNRDYIRDWFQSKFLYRNLNVLYMGYPHQKYGYKLVKKLYENTRDLELCYNIRHQDAHMQKDHEEARSSWLNEKRRINHYTGFLDEREYEKLIKASDIVIIPYARSEYPYQTSGVFIEALSANKVIIATDGTWFGNVVKYLGVGEVFESGNENSLNLAMRRAVVNYRIHKKSATIHGKRYRKYWSMKNLFCYLGITDVTNKEKLINNVY